MIGFKKKLRNFVMIDYCDGDDMVIEVESFLGDSKTKKTRT